MSICEVYEWLAEKYPQYQYTKTKIRNVLHHDSERQQPRFMIANKHRLPGVPCRWAIWPEMEPELRRLCNPPLGRDSQVLQTLGDRFHCTEDDQPTEAVGRNKTGPDAASSAIAVLQKIPRDNFRRGSLYTKATIALRNGTVELGRVKIDGDSIHNLLPRSIAVKLGLSLHSSSTIRIRVENRSILISQYCRFSIQVAGVETTIDTYVVSELTSLLLGRAWIQEVRLLRGVGNHIYYIRGPLGNLIKLPNPASATEADTDFVTGEREAAPAAEDLPTAAEAGGCELGDSGDETTSEEEVWKDTVSRQSTEDDLYSVDRVLAEKQGDGGTRYLLLWDGYTEDQATWEPLQNIRDTELLDIWRERNAQELRGTVPAFDLVNFEKRRRKRLGLALRERRSKLQMKRVGMPVLSSELMLMILEG
jgi:hypothetical protein